MSEQEGNFNLIDLSVKEIIRHSENKDKRIAELEEALQLIIKDYDKNYANQVRVIATEALEGME